MDNKDLIIEMYRSTVTLLCNDLAKLTNTDYMDVRNKYIMEGYKTILEYMPANGRQDN